LELLYSIGIYFHIFPVLYFLDIILYLTISSWNLYTPWFSYCPIFYVTNDNA